MQDDEIFDQDRFDGSRADCADDIRIRASRRANAVGAEAGYGYGYLTRAARLFPTRWAPATPACVEGVRRKCRALFFRARTPVYMRRAVLGRRRRSSHVRADYFASLHRREKFMLAVVPDEDCC
jgi:hypothetical protein